MYLAFHQEFRNDGGNSRNTRFWFLNTEEEVLDKLVHVAINNGNRIELINPAVFNITKQLVASLKEKLKAGPVWIFENERHGNGDLLGYARRGTNDIPSEFEIDLGKYLEESVTFTEHEDFTPGDPL